MRSIAATHPPPSQLGRCHQRHRNDEADLLHSGRERAHDRRAFVAVVILPPHSNRFANHDAKRVGRRRVLPGSGGPPIVATGSRRPRTSHGMTQRQLPLPRRRRRVSKGLRHILSFQFRQLSEDLGRGHPIATTVATGIRSPRIHGWPAILSGSMVMRSKSHLGRRARPVHGAIAITSADPKGADRQTREARP